MSNLHSLPANRLLARLPAAEFQRVTERMRPVELGFKEVLYKHQAPIEHVYFPSRGMASAMTIMQDGSAIEVATIGNEGVIGLSVLLAGQTSANEVLMQVAGEALRIDATDFQEIAGHDSPLRRLLLLYHTSFLTQISYSVACNGLHPIQKRCCRWLLTTRDRTDSDTLPLTHEFLGIMLGVRRASVTDVLRTLQEQGLVSNSRGAITIVDRPGLERLSCECYRAVKDEYERLVS
jgi:CRP-like cAMP-binding protein